jgi:hypothetical protein
MNLLLAAAETTSETELPSWLPVLLGITVFATLALLLFLVSRLDLDR